MIYATRNHAFVPAQTWVLAGPLLQIMDGQGPPRLVSLGDVTAVRLTFAPTRFEPKRYLCQLTLRNAPDLEFFNRTYVGVADFADTSTEYVAFVRALHAALSAHSPDCKFTAGVSGGRYALNCATTIFGAFMVLVAALFLIFNGLALLILLKIALMAIFFPNVFRWLARNKPRDYRADTIPQDVLPAQAPPPLPVTAA